MSKPFYIPLYHKSLMEKFNPWEVKGDIDYQKLVKEFGIKPLEELPESFSSHVLFRRNVIFAHRDIGRILSCIKENKPFGMMTGLMPTGKMHIGHMVVAQQMIFWQKLGAKVFICVADVEAYNARGQSLKESRKIAVEEYIANYIALGLDPKKADIYFQSDRSNDSKKSNAFYRLQNLLARHATFNEFKAVYGEITPGKMISALLQGADMLHPQLPEFVGKMPVIIPVGIDQDPHIRLARDMAKKIKEYNFIPPVSSYHLFMPGLSGGKMSSSDPNSFIALSDTPKQAIKKINKYAFSGGQATVEEHREKGGNPDVDVSFTYLKYFFEEDDKKLKELYNKYKSGKLLSGELKKITGEKIATFLENLNNQREKTKDLLKAFE